MKTKILGILICMLLIATVLPIPVTASIYKNESKSETTNDVSISFTFVRGLFKFISEDEDRVKLSTRFAKILYIRSDGESAAIRFFTPKNIWLAKPLYCVRSDTYSIICGFCSDWGYI